MFTPDQERAAAELVRVCRPGGTIALANWTPSSFVGRMFRTATGYVPAPAGVRPPGLWGPRSGCRSCSGRRCRAWRSPGGWCSASGRPTSSCGSSGTTTARSTRAFQALDEPGRERLYEDLAALAREHDRAPGPSPAMPSDYLEVVAIRG
jgi:hypothetical protein